MDWSFITDLLSHFQTENIMEFLDNKRIGDLVTEPVFLAAMVVISLLCLLFRLRFLFTVIVGVTGFAFLVSYTLERGSEIEGLNNPTLLVFVGAGAVMVGLAIYFLFIRGD